MRRPNKRQRKKNAKRDGTWIKQPAGRPQRFRKVKRGHPDSAPITRRWKTISVRFEFRADDGRLRLVESMVRERIGARDHLRAFMKLVYPEIERSWHLDCVCDHLASRYGR